MSRMKPDDVFLSYVALNIFSFLSIPFSIRLLSGTRMGIVFIFCLSFSFLCSILQIKYEITIGRQSEQMEKES